MRVRQEVGHLWAPQEPVACSVVQGREGSHRKAAGVLLQVRGIPPDVTGDNLEVSLQGGVSREGTVRVNVVHLSP